MSKKKSGEGIATYSSVPASETGLGPGSAGQSGDTQGLSGEAEAGSESVVELLEEGQAFEAEVIDGVEDEGQDDIRKDGHVAEVHTRQFPEDDVPEEYLNSDEHLNADEDLDND